MSDVFDGLEDLDIFGDNTVQYHCTDVLYARDEQYPGEFRSFLPCLRPYSSGRYRVERFRENQAWLDTFRTPRTEPDWAFCRNVNHHAMPLSLKEAKVT